MKARVKNLYNRIFFTPQPLPAGSSSAILDIDGTPNRLFLRIDPEGSGLLVVNASTVLHLNPTATEIASYLIKKMSIEEISQELVKRYQVPAEIARQDVEDLIIRIKTLMQTPDLDPETYLDMDRVDRHSSTLSAPLRLDCALTYQVPTGQAEGTTPVQRVDRALETSEWKHVLDQAWEWGIPHVVFTGGEPTMRPDLVELIQHAEELGQVTGLITDGLRLAEKEYLSSLLNAGLDHLLLVLQEQEELSWESIKDVVNADIHLTVHFTINQHNFGRISEIFARLYGLGVNHISISASNKEYSPYLAEAGRKAAEVGFRLVYDLPVPYSKLNPVSLELEGDVTAIEGQGRSWLYVEPDGDVLPGQGILHNLGNLAHDSWMTISLKRKLYLSQ